MAGRICVVYCPRQRLRIITHTHLESLQKRSLIVNIRRDKLDTLLLERFGGIFGSVSGDTPDLPRLVFEQSLHHGTALHPRGAQNGNRLLRHVAFSLEMV